jgi:hypothetical protein
MQEETKAYIMALLFIIFVLPFLIYYYFDFCCWFGLVIPSPEPEKTVCVVKPRPELEQTPDWPDTQNDTLETNSQLIEDVISGLQNLGFKKKDAKFAVLKACENKMFEDHQSLIEAALEKSNR